jgi:hypothetical protein
MFAWFCTLSYAIPIIIVQIMVISQPARKYPYIIANPPTVNPQRPRARARDTLHRLARVWLLKDNDRL